MKIKIENQPADQDDKILHDGILASNAESTGEEAKHFSIFLRDDDDQVLGGISLYFNSETLYIDILWIQTALRHQGYGSKLLKMAEKEGVDRGCQSAIVDTFDFQAKNFYEHFGYKVVAEVKMYLKGHSRIFLKKELS